MSQSKVFLFKELFMFFKVCCSIHLVAKLQSVLQNYCNSNTEAFYNLGPAGGSLFYGTQMLALVTPIPGFTLNPLASS
jgi:hypothetical protein